MELDGKVNRIKKNSINKETERETENEEKSCVRKWTYNSREKSGFVAMKRT